MTSDSIASVLGAEQKNADSAAAAPVADLLGLLEHRAEIQPDFPIYHYLRDGEDLAETLSFRDVALKAKTVAAALQGIAAEGERVMLLYLPGIEFITSYFGCLYAKHIAIPLPPPRQSRMLQTLEKVLEIARSAQPVAVLTTQAVKEKAEEHFGSLPEFAAMRWLATDTLDAGLADGWRKPDVAADDIAFLQYTSGSTSLPKGVILTHANLMCNMQYFDRSGVHSAESRLLTWLPPFHDLGLIYGLLTPVYCGMACYILPNAAFVQRPARWLEAISRFGITHTMGPNFAFDLCLHGVGDEQLAGLDLSRWQHALNGAEPVRMQTMRAFAERFAAAGFDFRVFSPSWGLAEAACIVTGLHYAGSGQHRQQRPAAEEVWVRAAELQRNRLVFASADEPSALSLAGSGYPIADTELLIVDPDTLAPCPADRVGEVWVRNGAVSPGYWQNPEQTQATFHACVAGDDSGRRWMRTGDLGFLYADQLYITGRLKDVIIVRGQNHYPQDIEWTVDKAHPLLKMGGAAAFTVSADGEERLVVVAETSRRFKAEQHAQELFAAIRKAVADGHELQTAAIALLRESAIPKTTSGKIQRAATKRGFLQQSLQPLAQWINRNLERQLAPTESGAAATRPDAEAVRAWLRQRVAEVSGLEPAEIGCDAAFGEFGLDSNLSVRLTDELEKAFGYGRLPANLLFDYPSIDRVVEYLCRGEAETLASESAAEASADIAIVGMACRFPGADDTAAFWDLLSAGTSAVRPLPAERKALLAGLVDDVDALGAAGWLDGIDLFDPAPFHISPKEAEILDPQQRLLLTAAWTALEQAGISREELAGSATGVFIGISGSEYGQLAWRSDSSLDGHAGTGTAASIAANRLSYFLDLRGPSLAVDTACSSSLVAVHLACQSLLAGECDTALVGGVNLMLNPALTRALGKAGMLSVTAACHSFDAAADGYVRGEGVGLVVLRRETLAAGRGNRVLAYIAGSAINQDGHSFGLTAPNGVAQRALLRRAYAAAKLEPNTVDYLEAHGTGTALGDPIEAGALAEVVGAGRERPCLIGSVKANIGHLEAAAGIAGLIKAVLCLQHNAVPPLAGFSALNPHIRFDAKALAVNTELRRFAAEQPLRHIGVTSMGFGGSNAHVVLRRAEPAVAAVNRPQRSHYALLLSAERPADLAALAAVYLDFLPAGAERWASLCYQANRGRSGLPYRSVLHAADSGELLAGLARLAQSGQAGPAAVVGTPKPLALLFTGQGSQYAGMARGLYAHAPVFRATVDQCDLLLSGAGMAPVAPLLYGPDALDSDHLAETATAQPALFVVGYALARYFESCGLAPAVAVGHSLGEYVAACFAGAMSLADALRLVVLRAQLMQRCSDRGGMLAMLTDKAAALELIAADPGLALAADNGPAQVTVSGPLPALEALTERAKAAGIAVLPLKVKRAFHSADMEPILEEFRAVANQVAWQAPRLPVIGNLHAAPVARFDADYWVEHLRQPVRFRECIAAAEALGAGTFLEIGAQPALAAMLRRFDPAPAVVSSLDAQRPDWLALNSALAELWRAGYRVDFGAAWAGETFDQLDLPGYPFQPSRFWLQPTTRTPMTTATATTTTGELARLLAPLLKCATDDIDPNRSFLELGADSLVLVEFLRQVQGRFGVQVAIHSLFEDLRSLQALAAWLAEQGATLPAGAEAESAAAIVEVASWLQRQLGLLLKRPADELDNRRSFLELGADSLVLTELLRLVSERYAVDIGMARLFAELSSIDTLAPAIAAASPTLDAEPAAVAALPAAAESEQAPLPSAAPGAAAPGDWHGLLERQLDAFNRLVQDQLGLLRGGVSSPSQPAPAVPASSPSPAPAAAPALRPATPLPATGNAAAAGLNPAQQQHLRELAAAYQAKHAGSKRYAETYREVFADYRSSLGFRQATKAMIFPLVVKTAAGSRIYDLDGNEFVDLTMAFGSSLLGYNPELVKQALAAQLADGIQVGPKSPLVGEAAQLVRDLTGCERVAFANSGTEAVMTAVRLARAVSGRTRIVRFAGSYHGHSDTMLVKAGGEGGSGLPIAPGVPLSVAQDAIVLAYGDEAALATIQRHAGELAAIVVEPVQSRRPGLQPREFLQRLREIASAAGCALIFDEIITGFRLAPGGAQEYFGVRADLVTYGKVAGGGMPIGIVAGNARFMNAIDGGPWQFDDDSYPAATATFFAGTFSGHPLTMAAAVAVLRQLRDAGPALQAGITAKTARLVQELNDYFAAEGFAIRVNHAGSLFRFVFFDNYSVEFQPIEANLFFYHMTLRGVYIWEGHTCFLSSAHSDADVDFIVRAGRESAQALRQGGFFPPPAGSPLPASRDAAGSEAGAQALNALATALAAQALQELQALPAHIGGICKVERAAGAIGVAPKRRRLFGRMFAMLNEAGWLRAVGEDWELLQSLPVATADLEREARSSADAAAVDLLLHCAAALPAVLCGRSDAAEVLFGGENYALLQRLYRHAPGAAAANAALARAAAAAAAVADVSGKAAVLEVGAGTGSATAQLLPGLSRRDLRYLFTDLSSAFLHRAEREFAAYPQVEYATLDIERDPAEQGFVRQSFDLIVASNVLHATADLGKTLNHLRSLLAPNGRLLLLECVGRQPWLDLIFGLTDGWWAFQDSTLRADYPLLPAAAWTELLQRAGFIEAAAEVHAGYQAVITARLPQAPAALPLNGAQQDILVHLELSEEVQAAYNELVLFELAGAPERDKLEQAFRGVVARHDSLRAALSEDRSQVVIGQEPDTTLVEADFSDLPDALAEAKAREWVLARSAEPFDLTRPPLIKAFLARLGDDRYWLLFLAHHMIIDGISYGLLIQEIVEFYRHLSDGSALALPRPVTLAEANRRVAAQRPQDREFWLQQFGQGVPALDLPTDYPRPPEQRFAAQRTCLVLDAEVAAQLKALTQRCNATPFMVMLAVYRLLLNRLSGQQRSVIGVPVSMHGDRPGESFIGFGVNVLPIVGNSDSQATFADYLQQAKHVFLQAFEHRGFPFAELVRAVNPERDPSRPALVSAVFNYEAVGALAGGGLRFTPLVPPSAHTKYELTLDVVADASQTVLVLTYNTALFAADTAERLLARYAKLLAQLAAAPDTRLGSIDLLLDEEREGLGMNPPIAYDNRCLHHLCADQAKRTPERIALRWHDTELSYRELDAQANRLAHLLQQHGVGVEDRVAVCLARGPQLVVALLAVLKAGACYVPVDPNYPAERRAVILRCAEAKLLLADTADAAISAAANAAPLLSPADPRLASCPDTAPASAVRPEHLAYIIFTSGSTGLPKGVAIEHRNAASMIDWAAQEFALPAGAGMLASTSVCFDLSVYEIFYPLAHGGKVVMVDNILHLPELARQDDIAVINTVPSAMEEILRQRAVPASVRTINLAGEALPLALVQGIQQHYPDVAVYNLYGPSEDTTYSTFVRFPERFQGPVTIGRPIAGSQLYLLDPDLNPVPAGGKGEIYLAGNGLCRGYFGNQAGTAAAFLPDPFSATPGARMYRTGDLGRLNPDGMVEYLGRSDFQVKIRGHRIELGEIETVLAQVPGVQRAVVIADGEPGRQRLLAFYSAETELGDALKQTAAAKLPAFMVPGVCTRVTEFPLSPNGKIDRRQLAQLAHGQEPTEAGPGGQLPRNALESEIAAIWAEHLQLDSIHIGDDFFALGGHSLLATQILYEINRRHGCRLRLTDIMKHPTVAELAEAVLERALQDSPDLQALLAELVRDGAELAAS
ncbi:amino acid adenylation domain-containing protein [Methylomonas sp. EFPC3]|uniref:non-ribosomal peptide synthetase/type I polyketide synthase n=1 Tax=Methylomonas sp. EFPC3 TaxID=3021710 RepID=UPI002417D18F|nr:non-ribosomal peptide synthetase/type I polyketide synthase [Methylomonas sp. EFPC3]WFP51891.1 amino acid adenylation domain-containing protein [Methylomonas sp. EFPC3]